MGLYETRVVVGVRETSSDVRGHEMNARNVGIMFLFQVLSSGQTVVRLSPPPQVIFTTLQPWST